MSQIPYFAPWTVGGLLNLRAANTRALYGSALIGGAVEWYYSDYSDMSKSKVLQ